VVKEAEANGQRKSVIGALKAAGNETSSFPRIFPRTFRFNVASSPGSPLTHLLDGHGDIVGCCAIPASSCPGPVQYPWGSIIELKVPPDETPGLMTLHPHNTNVLQNITYMPNHRNHPAYPIRDKNTKNLAYGAFFP